MTKAFFRTSSVNRSIVRRQLPSTWQNLHEEDGYIVMPTYAPEMRTTLARCAFELFAERGIANTNIDAVATKACVTKGSFYWHYKSKRELILAACDFYYSRWHCRVKKEIASTAEPLEKLERVLRFSVQSCLFDKTNRVFTAEIFTLAHQDTEIRTGWARFYDSVRGLMADLIRESHEAGQLGKADPYVAADWMLAAIEGIKQRASFEPQICTRKERERIVQGLLQIVFATTGCVRD